MTLSILVFNFYAVTAVMIVLLAPLDDGEGSKAADAGTREAAFFEPEPSNVLLLTVQSQKYLDGSGRVGWL